MEETKIWTKILAEIKKEVSASTFKTWFLGSRCVEYKKTNDKNVLIVAFRNNFLKEEVEKRYLLLIANLAKKEAGGQIEVFLIVSQTEKIKTKKPQTTYSKKPGLTLSGLLC